MLDKSKLYDSSEVSLLIGRIKSETPAIVLISLVRAGRKCDEKAYAHIATLSRELISRGSQVFLVSEAVSAGWKNHELQQITTGMKFHSSFLKPNCSKEARHDMKITSNCSMPSNAAIKYERYDTNALHGICNFVVDAVGNRAESKASAYVEVEPQTTQKSKAVRFGQLDLGDHADESVSKPLRSKQIPLEEHYDDCGDCVLPQLNSQNLKSCLLEQQVTQKTLTHIRS